jgi:acetylornithine deacetylase/succinyl-diaminopimelate desuccinylase-like protein
LCEEATRLIDKEELAELAVQLGGCYGPTGHEKLTAEFVFNWLKKNGFDAVLNKVEDERCNVICVIEGDDKNANSFLFNSHLDTAYAPDYKDEIWSLGPLERSETEVWREGDVIMGMNAVNDRGPMAAFLLAAKAIRDSGTKHRGDLILTSVMGEIDNAPIDEFQGFSFEGSGIGSRHLIEHGIIPDYALVAECTDFAITWTEAGVLWVKISVKGRRVYTPYVTHPLDPCENSNAIFKMARIIQDLEQWATEYESRYQYNFSGGTVIPKVNIGAIRGGLPNKAMVSAALCSIYIDIRLPPHANPSVVLSELMKRIIHTGIEAEVQPYLFRRGHEGRNVEEIVGAIKLAHKEIFGDEPIRIASPVTSMWRDINVFNEAGIPAITYGPPVHGYYSIKVDELYSASKVYALTALDISNRNRRVSAPVIS